MNLKKSREQFFRLLDAAAGQRILDVGAGKGSVAHRVLLASGADVYAIDPDERRIEFIRERHHGVKCQVGTAESIPFADSFFDRLYSSMALHHFTDVRLALGEFERVVRSGGLVVIVDVDPRSWNGKILRFFENTIMRHNTRLLSQSQVLEELNLREGLRAQAQFSGGSYYIIQCVKESKNVS